MCLILHACLNYIFSSFYLLHLAAIFLSFVISNRKIPLIFLASSGWDEARCAMSLKRASVWRLPEDYNR